MTSISIVIPVYRDTAALDSLLDLLLPSLPAGDAEVIVAGMVEERDELAALATRHRPVRWVEAPRGRAAQMNAGAAAASGRWLLFLHADTRLSGRWPEAIAEAERDPTVVLGCFALALASDARAARVVEAGVRWRVRWFGLPYGDQALFVRADAFRAIGGYGAVPIMEDVDLVRRLRAHGRLYRSPLPATTSARRWEAQGWVRRSAINIALMVLYALGVAPEKLYRLDRARTTDQGRRTEDAQGPRTKDGRGTRDQDPRTL